MNMNQNEKIKVLAEYKELKELISNAEKRAKELRDIAIEQIGSGEVGDYVVIIEDAERETFSLKDAKAHVTPSVWEKISAFVKVTSYQTLKVAVKK